MKLQISLGILAFASLSAFSQTDTAYDEPVYDSLMLPPPVEMPMDAVGVESAADMAYPYEEIVPYQPFNQFKNNSKIKPEEKPDKKAVYSQGTGAMLEQISNQLLVPYRYDMANKYVIIKFVVGKDSMLYNPEVLYTPGAEYSINATNVIEQLQDRFIPATRNGKPVDSILIVPIRFVRRSNPYGEG